MGFEPYCFLDADRAGRDEFLRIAPERRDQKGI